MIRVPLILTILLALLLGCAAESRAASEAKPNILFILTDDMREDDLAHMPKTQELVGSEGLTFENSYATYPRCCPARATILTGLYTHNHGVKVNEGGWQTFRDKGNEERTIAKSLDEAGYRTALFGKYLNGYTDATYIPPGWDEWHAALGGRKEARHYYYDYNMSENGVKVHYGSQPSDYRQDVISDKVDAFIRTSEPFFAYVSVTAPHGPATPAPRHKNLDMGPRAKSLQAVDDLVERLVNTLEETGELENTYIFFTSDNGFMQGEHGIEKGKLVYYEESASTPLLVRGPGIEAGTSTKLVGNHDYAPTWAEIAGTSFPADGRSLFGASRNQLLLENPSKDGGPYTAVVTKQYKYVRKSGQDKLFDLANDPREKTNLLDAKDRTLATPPDLTEKLDALEVCVGESCREAEDS